MARLRGLFVLLESSRRSLAIGDFMFAKLMPKENRFFDYFEALADEAVKISRELETMLRSFDDLQDRSFNIETIEKRGDRITHDTIALLHTTFITPIDRDAIHRLITRMDDILDLSEDVAQSVVLYDVQETTPEACKLAALCVACCQHVKRATELLRDMRHAEPILNICAEIDKLESEADRVMRAAMARLFREETDVKKLIKLRSIYELLETITDACEDVANLIEGIVVENA
jgi:predicted phosphate transport protein (TIGR00153 family)